MLLELPALIETSLEDTTDYATPFFPSPLDQAERLGYEVGLSGEAGNHPDDTRSTPAYHHFTAGWLAGCRERWLREDAERAEREAWLDTFARREDDASYDEWVRSRSFVGHPASE